MQATVQLEVYFYRKKNLVSGILLPTLPGDCLQLWRGTIMPERETLAVVHALCMLTLYLYNSFEVLTNNLGSRTLNPRRVYPDVKLGGWNFCLSSISRSSIDLVLTTWRTLYPEDLARIDLNLFTSISTSDSEEDSLTQDYQQDRQAQVIIDRLSRSPADAFHNQYQWDEVSQRLFVRWKDTWWLYIPKGNMHLKLLKEYHNCLLLVTKDATALILACTAMCLGRE